MANGKPKYVDQTSSKAQEEMIKKIVENSVDKGFKTEHFGEFEVGNENVSYADIKAELELHKKMVLGGLGVPAAMLKDDGNLHISGLKFKLDEIEKKAEEKLNDSYDALAYAISQGDTYIALHKDDPLSSKGISNVVPDASQAFKKVTSPLASPLDEPTASEINDLALKAEEGLGKMYDKFKDVKKNPKDYRIISCTTVYDPETFNIKVSVEVKNMLSFKTETYSFTAEELMALVMNQANPPVVLQVPESATPAEVASIKKKWTEEISFHSFAFVHTPADIGAALKKPEEKITDPFIRKVDLSEG
jgi:hypothetical protein